MHPLSEWPSNARPQGRGLLTQGRSLTVAVRITDVTTRLDRLGRIVKYFTNSSDIPYRPIAKRSETAFNVPWSVNWTFSSR